MKKENKRTKEFDYSKFEKEAIAKLRYSDDWIAKRLQSVEVRGQLTDEWKERGIKEGYEYSILTAEISRVTFGMQIICFKISNLFT